MEGKEFLTVAQKLVQIRSAAAIRSATSRTYYAIFNTGIKLLNELGFSFPKDASAHELLYYRLNNAGLPDISELAIATRVRTKNQQRLDRSCLKFSSNYIHQTISLKEVKSSCPAVKSVNGIRLPRTSAKNV